MGCTLKDSEKGSTKISCFLYFLSYTVTSRENVYHIFRFLGEPKTLNLAHTASCGAVRKSVNYFTSVNTNIPRISNITPPIMAMSVTQCPKYCFIKAIKQFTIPTPIETEPISPKIPPIAPNVLPLCVVGLKALLGAIHK